MGRVGAQVVVRAFDPEPIGEVSPQRHLDSVTIEAASEIVHLVLFEGRENSTDVKPIAGIPRTEYRSLVATLRLVESWTVDAVTHLVVGCADSEPRPVSEDDRA